jgi:hypothetical protein
LKMTDGLGRTDWLTEAGVKVFEDTDCNEQRAMRTRHIITKILACYEDILEETR